MASRKSFAELIRSAKYEGRQFRISDPQNPNLKVLVNKHSKTFLFRHKGVQHKIGNVSDAFTVTQARDEVKKLLGNYASAQPGVIEKERHYERSSKMSFCELAEKICQTYPAPTLKVRFQSSRTALNTFWNMPIGDITKAKVIEWMNKYSVNRKPSTVKMHFDYLSGCLNKAVEMELLESNPLLGIKKPKVVNKRTRHLGESSSDEFDRFVKVVDAREDHMRLFCYLGLYTGMRKSEMLTLQWSFINWKDEYLVLPKHKTVQAIGEKFVDLHPKAVAELKLWQEKCPNEKYVFPGPDGGPMKDIKKAWATLIRDAEITDFRPHDLRHTFASQMLMAGASLSDIAGVVGHTDPRMTARYAHLSREHLKNAIGRLK